MNIYSYTDFKINKRKGHQPNSPKSSGTPDGHPKNNCHFRSSD